MNTFDHIPRLDMSRLPTPLQRLNALSRLSDVELYCKRDDLTGFGGGGNKTRKLDFLVADALGKGADTLIALGANQSNFCRMASAAGAANGLTVHLVPGGSTPVGWSGRIIGIGVAKNETRLTEEVLRLARHTGGAIQLFE